MELDAVNVLKEDVETVMAEFDLDKAEADSLLRESQGNLKKTLLSLVRGGLKAK
jgi:NACalpha-BTF3-like transcription factor